MKLGILTALWGRPQLTEIYLNRMQYLQQKYGIIGACVGTENEFKQDCLDRGIIYADHKNKPVSNKWNHGMLSFRDEDVDHVMIMGSDDFASDSFYEHSMKVAKNKDFSGSTDLYIFGGRDNRRGFKQFFYFAYSGYLVGPGRCYSKRILEMLDFTPWGMGKNAGLDGSIAKNVKKLGRTVRRKSFGIKTEGLFMVDIKTKNNISSIPGASKIDERDFRDVLTQNLPPKEARDLIALLTQLGAV